MVLIATTDLALAKQLVEIVVGEKSLLLTAERPESDVDPDGLGAPSTDRVSRAEAGQRWLRHCIYEREPDVLLLDVGFGGSLYRALESVPRIVERGTRVILVVPFERGSVEDVAVALGCFDVINQQASGFSEIASESVSAALRARPVSATRAPERKKMH